MSKGRSALTTSFESAHSGHALQARGAISGLATRRQSIGSKRRGCRERQSLQTPQEPNLAQSSTKRPCSGRRQPRVVVRDVLGRWRRDVVGLEELLLDPLAVGLDSLLVLLGLRRGQRPPGALPRGQRREVLAVRADAKLGCARRSCRAIALSRSSAAAFSWSSSRQASGARSKIWIGAGRPGILIQNWDRHGPARHHPKLG